MMKLESSLTKPLYLIFYANCVHLEGFPPFSYGSKDSVGLITDLMDGYFPRVLEKSHPDGVLMELVDRLDELKSGQGEDRINRGGIKIGGREYASGREAVDKIKTKNLGTPLNQLVKGYEDLGLKSLGREMKKEEFLKKLPEKIIKNGMIIDVRNEVSKQLGLGTKGGYPIGYSDENWLSKEEGINSQPAGESLLDLYPINKHTFVEKLRNCA